MKHYLDVNIKQQNGYNCLAFTLPFRKKTVKLKLRDECKSDIIALLLRKQKRQNREVPSVAGTPG